MSKAYEHRSLILALPLIFAGLTVGVAQTQTPDPTPPNSTPPEAETPEAEGFEEGMGLLGEGTRMILRGLMSELEPLMENLRGQIEDLEDLGAYYPPEVLPNGDIIIRRKIPLQPTPPIDGGPIIGKDGEVEL